VTGGNQGLGTSYFGLLMGLLGPSCGLARALLSGRVLTGQVHTPCLTPELPIAQGSEPQRRQPP
jgi:hypothetical protein